MLKKYDGFLLEKLKFEMFSLLEDHLYGTTDFIFKLKDIFKKGGRSGAIAEQILNIIESEQWFNSGDVKQNYFDITSEEDKVSFINNHKVLAADYDEDEHPEFPYSMPGRGEIKIGRIVKYLYKLRNMSLPDSDLESFVNLWKSSNTENSIEFKLVSGSDISKYYKEDNYYTRNGSLGGSCMKEEGNSTFKLYSENDSVKLLIYVDSDDKIHGRALVWKLKTSPCESQYFMDRVYSNRDSDINRFREFADSNNWMYKKKMNSHLDTNVLFVYKGQEVSGEIKVEVKGDFRKYPFVDTLCFLSKSKDILSNLPDKKSWKLHSVYGSKDRCYDCGGMIIDDGNLCDGCSIGHQELKSMGIETKWNKKVTKD
jgi:hypothetical protein